MALIRRVFLRLVAKLSDGCLGEGIETKFYVNLGKNASDTCAMLSEELMGEKLRKSQVFLSGINSSKRVART
jgi:hypothetical protein